MNNIVFQEKNTVDFCYTDKCATAQGEMATLCYSTPFSVTEKAEKKKLLNLVLS